MNCVLVLFENSNPIQSKMIIQWKDKVSRYQLPDIHEHVHWFICSISLFLFSSLVSVCVCFWKWLKLHLMAVQNNFLLEKSIDVRLWFRYIYCAIATSKMCIHTESWAYKRRLHFYDSTSIRNTADSWPVQRLDEMSAWLLYGHKCFISIECMKHSVRLFNIEYSC